MQDDSRQFANINRYALKMLNTVKERLIAYLDYKGVSKSEFGRRIGVSSAFVTSIRKSIQPGKISNIQREFPDLDTSWLLTGEGEMLKSAVMPEYNVMEVGRAFPASGRDEGVTEVRFFQVTPSATFQEFLDSSSKDPEMIPIVPPGGELIGEESCVFEIIGESMSPQIPNGAKVLCREIPPTRWHNLTSGVIVIAYADSFVIKRIVHNRLASEDYLDINSDNPDFPGTVRVSRSEIRCIFEARHVLSYPIR